jgi:hypothetical protein
MQEEAKRDIPMVDIDTSGPEQEVELENEAQTEEQIETKENEVSETETKDPSSQPQEASSEEQEAQKDAKDKELENYSKDVQRRIAKLTGKWREAQRQRDEALAFAKVQKTQREELLKRYSSVEQAGVKDREERIKSGLLAAQTKLANARANDDVAGEVEAQKEIARLGYEEARLAEAKSMAESSPKVESKDEIPSFEQQPQKQVTTDPKAEAWGAKNKWFGSDTAMTYTAFDIHNKLEAEGYDPSSDEYYAEIDKRIRLEFPHKFGTTSDTTAENSTKPVQTVASATRSTKSGRKTVRLTPSEVAIAKKLGVSLEDYAKQKKYMKEV